MNLNFINLYNYYSNPKNEYFNLLRNFAEHLIDNDIIFEDENNNIDIKIYKNFTKEYSYSNEKELKFIYEYLIPEFIKNRFDTILYERDIIYLNRVNMFRSEEVITTRIIHNFLDFRKFMKEIIRIRCICGSNGYINIDKKNKYDTISFDTISVETIPLDKILYQDKRLYKDIINIIKSYLRFDEMILEFSWC